MLDPETQARFSMRSGYLPVRKSVLDRKDYVAFLSTDPALKAFVEQMAMGRARDPIDRKRIEVNRALAGAIEKATLGKGDPASCLHDAAVEADALLQGTTQ
jgi:ABC-type glycerol-3-phosphate transport system substrate-binding protein